MAQLMLVNPKRKTRRKARRKSVAANPRKRRATRKRARRNPVALANPRRKRAVRRRTRRNPKFSVASIQRQALVPAFAGGVGALALDIAFGALPIPANFKTGMIGSIAKIAGAIVLGKIAGKAFGAKIGEAVTVGGVTIQAYNTVKQFAQKAMPTLPMGEYISGGDFLYNNQFGQIGYTNAAAVLPDAPYNMGSQVGEYISGDDDSAYQGW